MVDVGTFRFVNIYAAIFPGTTSRPVLGILLASVRVGCIISYRFRSRLDSSIVASAFGMKSKLSITGWNGSAALLESYRIPD